MESFAAGMQTDRKRVKSGAQRITTHRRAISNPSPSIPRLETIKLGLVQEVGSFQKREPELPEKTLVFLRRIRGRARGRDYRPCVCERVHLLCLLQEGFGGVRVRRERIDPEPGIHEPFHLYAVGAEISGEVVELRWVKRTGIGARKTTGGGRVW